MRVLDIGGLFGMDAYRLWAGWENQFKEECVVEEVSHLTAMRDAQELLPKCDLVYFGGGADIHPSLYGHKNCGSMVGHLASARDIFEKQIFKDAVDKNIPIFGICRGAQLTCALSGGSLIQDVGGHGHDHNLLVITARGEMKEMWPIPSTHHQMMYIADIPQKAHLIAFTEKKGKRYGRDTAKIPVDRQDFDPEIVYFEDTNALAVQGHPENLPQDSTTSRAIRGMIKECLINRNKEMKLHV